jgi:hypothetical protein
MSFGDLMKTPSSGGAGPVDASPEKTSPTDTEQYMSMDAMYADLFHEPRRSDRAMVALSKDGCTWKFWCPTCREWSFILPGEADHYERNSQIRRANTVAAAHMTENVHKIGQFDDAA